MALHLRNIFNLETIVSAFCKFAMNFSMKWQEQYTAEAAEALLLWSYGNTDKKKTGFIS